MSTSYSHIARFKFTDQVSECSLPQLSGVELHQLQGCSRAKPCSAKTCSTGSDWLSANGLTFSFHKAAHCFLNVIPEFFSQQLAESATV